MKKTISVFVPVYNHEGLLPECLDSILSQSEQPDEILVINDASTDNTQSVMEAYAAQHACIRILQNTQNKGVIQSVNRLLEEAKCDWFVGCAADDYWEPGAVEAIRSVLPLAEEKGAALIFGKMRAIAMESEKELYVAGASTWDESNYINPENYLNKFLRIESPDLSLSGATTYNRRTLQKAGGFAEELGAWGDTFIIQYLGLKHGAVYIPQVLSNVRVDDSTYSGQLRNNASRLLETYLRGAAMMRDPKYAGVFPESYVTEFERRIKGYLRASFLLQANCDYREAAESYYNTVLPLVDRKSLKLKLLLKAASLLNDKLRAGISDYAAQP